MGQKHSNVKETIIITSREFYNIQADYWSHHEIVDVRSSDEYSRSHIDGAVLCSTYTPISGVKKPKFVIIYGSRANCEDEYIKAVRFLSKHFDRILQLQGGIEEYKERYPFQCTDDVAYVRSTLYPSHIGERLFLSNLGVATNALALRAMGITHIINCTADCPFPPASNDSPSPTMEEGGSELVDPKQQVEATLFSATMMRVPVIDDDFENIAQHFPAIFSFVETALSANSSNKVLFYCKHGQSRSATCAAAWLLHRQPADFSSPDAAIAHLKACRSKVGPNAGFRAQLSTIAPIPITDAGQQAAAS